MKHPIPFLLCFVYIVAMSCQSQKGPDNSTLKRNERTSLLLPPSNSRLNIETGKRRSSLLDSDEESYQSDEDTSNSEAPVVLDELHQNILSPVCWNNDFELLFWYNYQQKQKAANKYLDAKIDRLSQKTGEMLSCLTPYTTGITTQWVQLKGLTSPYYSVCFEKIKGHLSNLCGMAKTFCIPSTDQEYNALLKPHWEIDLWNLSGNLKNYLYQKLRPPKTIEEAIYQYQLPLKELNKVEEEFYLNPTLVVDMVEQMIGYYTKYQELCEFGRNKEYITKSYPVLSRSYYDIYQNRGQGQIASFFKKRFGEDEKQSEKEKNSIKQRTLQAPLKHAYLQRELSCEMQLPPLSTFATLDDISLLQNPASYFDFDEVQDTAYRAVYLRNTLSKLSSSWNGMNYAGFPLIESEDQGDNILGFIENPLNEDEELISRYVSGCFYRGLITNAKEALEEYYPEKYENVDFNKEKTYMLQFEQNVIDDCIQKLNHTHRPVLFGNVTWSNRHKWLKHMCKHSNLPLKYQDKLCYLTASNLSSKIDQSDPKMMSELLILAASNQYSKSVQYLAQRNTPHWPTKSVKKENLPMFESYYKELVQILTQTKVNYPSLCQIKDVGVIDKVVLSKKNYGKAGRRYILKSILEKTTSMNKVNHSSRKQVISNNLFSWRSRLLSMSMQEKALPPKEHDKVNMILLKKLPHGLERNCFDYHPIFRNAVISQCNKTARFCLKNNVNVYPSSTELEDLSILGDYVRVLPFEMEKLGEAPISMLQVPENILKMMHEKYDGTGRKFWNLSPTFFRRGIEQYLKIEENISLNKNSKFARNKIESNTNRLLQYLPRLDTKARKKIMSKPFWQNRLKMVNSMTKGDTALNNQEIDELLCCIWAMEGPKGKSFWVPLLLPMAVMNEWHNIKKLLLEWEWKQKKRTLLTNTTKWKIPQQYNGFTTPNELLLIYLWEKETNQGKVEILPKLLPMAIMNEWKKLVQKILTSNQNINPNSQKIKWVIPKEFNGCKTPLEMAQRKNNKE